jgi:hypothetical protein
MQQSAKNKTVKTVSKTSPNFGRVCASAVLQRTIVDLDHWKLQLLRIVEHKKVEDANAKLSEFLKKYNTAALDNRAKEILDRAESYLTLYAELVKEAKSDHDKIVKRIGNKRNYNIPDEVRSMIARMDASDVLEINVDSKNDRVNRQIIRCVVDGLVSSIDTLVVWSVKYTEKLQKTQTLINTIESVINDAKSYTDKDDRTKKILKKTYLHAKSIKTILKTKYELQINNLESLKTRHIEPQKVLLDKYYAKYAFLTGPESIYSKKSTGSVSNKSIRRRTPTQASQNPQAEISAPGKNILQRYSPATKFSLRPPLPPSVPRNKTHKIQTVLMPPLPGA